MHNHWMVVKVFVSKECRYVSFICFCKQYQFNSSFFVQLLGVSISEKKVKQINNNVFAERFAVHTLKKIDLAWMKYEKRNYLVCIYCAVIKFLLCTNSFDSATQWVEIFSETAFFFLFHPLPKAPRGVQILLSETVFSCLISFPYGS